MLSLMFNRITLILIIITDDRPTHYSKYCEKNCGVDNLF